MARGDGEAAGHHGGAGSGGAVLVLNAGSSSVKYRLIAAGTGRNGPQHLVRGQIERIGEPDGEAGDHAEAVGQVVEQLRDRPVTAVAHRVVHGGDRFREPVQIDDATLIAIEELARWAPLHNPAAAAGIRAARTALPQLPQLALFDTAFHATLPPAAFTYAIDRELAQQHGIRRYGFHGISIQYVVGETARLLQRPATQLNMIVLHLGNGASATAVADGASVDTSMGLTPLEGLVMGTRTGDIDPAVAFYLARAAGLNLDEVERQCQKHGGLAGLCGDNDLRAVQSRAVQGDPQAQLALDVYCHRIRKYIGAYHAVLGRLDAVVFTAGVGENSPVVRAGSLTGLQPLGITVDHALNDTRGSTARLISPIGSPVAVCVVPTDEERAIAQQTAAKLGLAGNW
ncbi:acetate/propionate family kinase [Rugosimonospora africana]|uniref:Acetate kinase n=1 Tax=Rugosimonospora africana TaxID=556532 RepID=A0A8J3VVS8_9ACTN|nr:acetate kinase [Rugosimonospora africana]GIH20081.1 acetate kinase [Rugosimonospora africana]